MPYLTNDDRIRLGLQHFGSDVPAHEIAAAEQTWRERQQANPEPEPEPEAEPVKRKRARKENGQLVGDDPTTADRNEAWTDA